MQREQTGPGADLDVGAVELGIEVEDGSGIGRGLAGGVEQGRIDDAESLHEVRTGLRILPCRPTCREAFDLGDDAEQFLCIAGGEGCDVEAYLTRRVGGAEIPFELEPAEGGMDGGAACVEPVGQFGADQAGPGCEASREYEVAKLLVDGAALRHGGWAVVEGARGMRRLGRS